MPLSMSSGPGFYHRKNDLACAGQRPGEARIVQKTSTGPFEVLPDGTLITKTGIDQGLVLSRGPQQRVWYEIVFKT